MMKKICFGLLAAAFCCATAFAHPPITVYVDGNVLSFDQPPIIREDRTLVPMRGIFQALGASVTWDEPPQTVTAMNMEDIILFRVGEQDLYKNGERIYTMPVPAQIVNDRLLVPLRAVAESIGAEVSWDGIGYVVDIVSAENPASEISTIEQQLPTEPIEGGFAAEIRAADGTVVLTAKLECDIVESGKGADKINTALAEETFALGQGFLREYAQAALVDYAKQGEAFLPYYCVGAYELTREENGYASFFASMTAYDGKKETRSYRSATYDLSKGKEQELSDLISDSKEELDSLWTASFGAIIAEEPKAFYEDAEERLAKELEQVDFYLTEDGIVFYLPPDTVAPMETGAISFEIEYEF